jgi:hypothetical protein
MSNQMEKYDDRIYQLDDLILDLYNVVYAKSGKYKIKYIDVADLKMSRFKLSDYNLDVIFDKTPIQYVGNFPTGLMVNGKNIEQIWIKRRGETHMCTIRIIPYINKDSINEMSDPINVNQIIKTLMSELVVNDKTNNILLPIVNIDIKGSDLTIYPKIEPLVDKNKYYSIQITEKFYSLMTLDRFLKEYPLNIRIFKTIIYQAVDVLYQISTTYPSFRYNQFIPEMMDCYLKTNNNVIFPELKLSDFYLSEISEIVSNNYLKSGQLPIPHIDSSYSDLYQFLNYLWNHNTADIEKYPELINLFDTLLPKKIRSSDTYLTNELWDKLSDEEKYDLRLKNIRNNTSLIDHDSLIETKFIETKDISELTGGSTESLQTTDDNINAETYYSNESPKKLKYDIKDIHESSNRNRKTNNGSTLDVKKIKTSIDMNPKNELDESSDDIFVEKISQKNDSHKVSPSNKKYSNNDIDIMSNKNSNKKNNSKMNDYKMNDYKMNDSKMNDSKINDSKMNDSKMNNFTDDDTSDGVTEVKDYADDLAEERTEERQHSEKPSRIINVSETNISSRKPGKNKLKTYHGKRRIANVNAMFQKDRYDQPMAEHNKGAQPHDNTFLLNGVASRVNSIGAALGVNPNDYTNRNQGMDYNQIAQQMTQQYQGNNVQVMPGHMPPNMPTQIPNQIQNPIGQPSVMQPDADAYYRYMTAMNQTPNQNQIDPALLAMYTQQNAQSQMPQMAQMPQQMPQMTQMPQQMPQMIPQMGGGSKRNFFFQ